MKELGMCVPGGSQNRPRHRSPGTIYGSKIPGAKGHEVSDSYLIREHTEQGLSTPDNQ